MMYRTISVSRRAQLSTHLNKAPTRNHAVDPTKTVDHFAMLPQSETYVYKGAAPDLTGASISRPSSIETVGNRPYLAPATKADELQFAGAFPPALQVRQMSGTAL
jgi:hypothetical protein